MADELIRIEGIRELMSLLTDISQLAPVKDGVAAAALYLKGKVDKYPAIKRPTRASVYGTTFKSVKQRKYFFAALKKGEIEVPYRRGESPSSETFGRRWTIETGNYGLRAIVGNNASYGPQLMDEEQQSLYARAVGWRTVQAILNEERDTITGIVQQGLQMAIAKR
jgi:hypothetical protein